MFQTSHSITFGDCDPAGILFYPNHFRMMDATFQAWLRSRGMSQGAVRRRFGAVGTGLVETDATFRAPVRDGDKLVHDLRVEWRERTLLARYRGTVEGTLAIEGRETRGLFVEEAGRLRLAPLEPLREALGV